MNIVSTIVCLSVCCLVYSTVILCRWQLSFESTFPCYFTDLQITNVAVSMSFFVFNFALSLLSAFLNRREMPELMCQIAQ